MLHHLLSFKSRLYVAIGLTLVGFSILAILSFTALQTLNNAFDQVDKLNQQILLLTDLELEVIKLDRVQDTSQLEASRSEYNKSLQLVFLNRQTPEQNKDIVEIQSHLDNWVQGKHQISVLERDYGYTSKDGFKGEVKSQLKILENKLFSNFRKIYSQLDAAVNLFIEQPTVKNDQDVRVALKLFSHQSNDFGFDKVYKPILTKLNQDYDQMSQAAFDIDKGMKEATSVRESLNSRVKQTNQFLEQELAQAQSRAELASLDAQNQILGVCIVIGLSIMILLIQTSRYVIKNLENISKALSNLAIGDLTQKLSTDSEAAPNDELAKAKGAVNELSSSLSKILGQVRINSQTLSQGSADLSRNLADMVENNLSTSDQAESVASASEQIKVVIQNMSHATDLAHEKSQQAQGSAAAGGEVITKAISSMGSLAYIFDDLSQQVTALEKASGKIDGVTEMINDLAEQTNLLALNAAIEAARAGEAGRGFSVVADEVRNLAEKTVQSTQHISSTISDMHKNLQSLLVTMSKGQEYVQTGRTLGDQAAIAIQEIKALVEDVAGCNHELIGNIRDVSDTTHSIASNMEQVARNVSCNKQQSLEIQAYVGDTHVKATQLEGMTEHFKY